MATYKVLKSHDGLKEGAIITAPSTSIQDLMVKNGYWERMEEPSAAVEAKNEESTAKAAKGGRKGRK